jgi:hypothetical protein
MGTPLCGIFILWNTPLMGGREDMQHDVGSSPLGGQVFLMYAKFWHVRGAGRVHAEELAL